MKWVKHLTSSRRDPDMCLARDQFGGDAIDIFWSTVELVAEEFKGGEATLSAPKSFFRQHIPGYSMNKVFKVWSFFGHVDRYKPRIIFTVDGEKVTVNVPKLTELGDRYSKTVYGNSPKARILSTPKPKEKITSAPTELGAPAPTPPPEYIPYKEIIDYLNLKADKRFTTVESHRKWIRARWREGATLEDFKTVVDVKTKEWKTDKVYNKYLRPETLFGNKFQGYLNDAPAEEQRSLVF